MPTEPRVGPPHVEAGCQRSAAASRSGSPPPVGLARRSTSQASVDAASARSWDAIVVGASFAGLAAAMELAGAGRVLLIDRSPIGDGETSACGTPLSVLARLQAIDALEQVHDEIILHLPSGQTTALRPRYPFATFSYQRLCTLLSERTDAHFLQAGVIGVTAGAVVTSRGIFRAPLLIDASGWRAVLGSAARPDLVPPKARSLGLELRVPRDERGLHFWIRPDEIGCGVMWLFPAGGHSRVGVACYRGKGGLKRPLERFLDGGLPTGALHGGFLPSQLRDPVAGDIFLVGDAAGQCLPLTGEGIRPALVFGQIAGRLARQVLAGELLLIEALARYRSAVHARRAQYRLLSGLQRALLGAPQRLLPAAARLLGSGPLTGPAQSAYWRVAPPDALSPGRPPFPG